MQNAALLLEDILVRYVLFVLMIGFAASGCGSDVKTGDPKPVDPSRLPSGLKRAGVGGPVKAEANDAPVAPGNIQP